MKIESGFIVKSSADRNENPTSGRLAVDLGEASPKNSHPEQKLRKSSEKLAPSKKAQKSSKKAQKKLKQSSEKVHK